MAIYPHSRLWLGSARTILASGPHIQVIDTKTGDIVHSTVAFEGTEKEGLLKSGPVRCGAVDNAFIHLITSGDDKRLKVWQIDGLKLLSERELPKKPTEIGFARDGQTIVISDKFGDVFSYSLHPDPSASPVVAVEPGVSKRGALTSHENPSNGRLILGHASLLTSYLLTPDDKFIITADRDEHIRVSWYPQGYVIERYCLGHEKFVSAIHIPSYAPSLLVSGGGDPMLKVWDWMSGELKAEISILEVVGPFIKLRPQKRNWRGEDDDDDERPAEEKKAAEKGKGKGRKKGKGKAKETGVVEGEQDEGNDEPLTEQRVEDVSMEQSNAPILDTEAPQGAPEAGPSEETTKDTGPVLVLHKIASCDLDMHGQYLVFSAIGATALFYCPFPQPGASSSAIQLLHFGKPVIDFVSGADGLLWVLLDGEWANSAVESATAPLVQCARWSSGKLEKVQDDSKLLKALNSECIIPATPAELKTLDIYSALTSMPKNVDPGHELVKRDFLSETATNAGDDVSKKELSLREQGRLKNKRALMAKLQAQNEKGTPLENEEERESKKPRSEADADSKDSNNVHDDTMDES